MTLPVTEWRDTQGLNEYSGETPNDIVDPSSHTLVDPSGNQIIDTGVVINRLPVTEWEEV